ncbi:hypothetical protein [Hyphococcus sp.]|uniref:hypothetical protein n=1 Tax=Hyphococcus sp. TaxID=2038636 RepID=UPI003D1005F9
MRRRWGLSIAAFFSLLAAAYAVLWVNTFTLGPSVAQISDDLVEYCKRVLSEEAHNHIPDVEGFTGYLGEGCPAWCQVQLLDGNYSFIEGQKGDRLPRADVPPVNLVREKGWYRFTLEQANHANCDAYYEQLEFREWGRTPPADVERIRAERSAPCIGAYKISGPAGEVLVRDVEWRYEVFDLRRKLRISGVEFLKADTEEVIAQFLEMRVFPRNIFHKGGEIGRRVCPEDSGYERALNAINSVFVPIKYRQDG